jgi:flagellin
MFPPAPWPRNTASEIGTVASLVLESPARTRASNEAQQSRVVHGLDSRQRAALGREAAVLRVTDVDVAAELTQLSRFSVLREWASAMWTHANVSQQLVLRLLFN